MEAKHAFEISVGIYLSVWKNFSEDLNLPFEYHALNTKVTRV
jgi:hypothetical protein